MVFPHYNVPGFLFFILLQCIDEGKESFRSSHGVFVDPVRMGHLGSNFRRWGENSTLAGLSTVKQAVESRLEDRKAPFQVRRSSEGRLVCRGEIVREWVGDP